MAGLCRSIAAPGWSFWAFFRLALVALAIYGLSLALSFAIFGRYQGNTLRFNIDVRLSRDGWVAVAVMLGALLVVFGWALVMLRLSMVIPAAAVAGQRFEPGRKWRMTNP